MTPHGINFLRLQKRGIAFQLLFINVDGVEEALSDSYWFTKLTAILRHLTPHGIYFLRLQKRGDAFSLMFLNVDGAEEALSRYYQPWIH